MVKRRALTKQGVKQADAESARLRTDRQRLQRCVRDQKRIVQLTRELKRATKRAGDELLLLATDLLARDQPEDPADEPANIQRELAASR